MAHFSSIAILRPRNELSNNLFFMFLLKINNIFKKMTKIIEYVYILYMLQKVNSSKNIIIPLLVGSRITH